MSKRKVASVILIILAVTIVVFFLIVIVRVGDSEAGASPSGERLERIKKSSNFAGDKFINEIPTVVTKNADYWEIIKAQFSDKDKRTPPGPLPTVKPDIQSFASGGKLKAIWLGHATVLFSINNVTLLTDPVFDDGLSIVVATTKRFQPTVVTREELPPIDGVLISHDHFDHLEMSSIQFFAKKGTIFFVPLGVGAHLESWDVPESQIVELDWGESREFKSLEIVCTPARHFSGRTLLRYYETQWASWTILGKNERVYFGGDTGYSGHFKQIGEQYGPFDLTIIPIGAYDKTWPEIHTFPEEAVDAHIDVKGNLLLPIHWGTFDVALHTWDEPIERFVKYAAEKQVNFVAPMMGERVSSDSRFNGTYWWRSLE
ncbi:MAG TPA: MBL fold metallo-hydrolase [candidate division Zixibacteria bacterium]|nr:MBL fold metallo-hydrolase [candidate division Zixibacteria bacterium]